MENFKNVMNAMDQNDFETFQKVILSRPFNMDGYNEFESYVMGFMTYMDPENARPYLEVLNSIARNFEDREMSYCISDIMDYCHKSKNSDRKYFESDEDQQRYITNLHILFGRS